MKRTLIDFLRCPITGTRLTLVDQAPTTGDEVLAGVLRAESGREYAIHDGVPVMLAPETLKPGQAETQASFSAKWAKAPDYRLTTRDHYVRWYLQRYHLGDISGLRTFLAGKQHILDVGTGHGRDAELFATNSQATVFAIDLSDGIYNAYRDLRGLHNVHCVQADLTLLPFPPAFFDFISCDQVLHHTSDMRASLHALLHHLAPGGSIAVYAYKKKGPIREFCDDYLRAATVRMSVEECLRFSRAVTAFGKALAQMKFEIEVPQDIPLLDIRAGKHDLQRFIYWHVFKCYWNDSIPWDANVITNFDWYHPLLAHRQTPEEIRRWFDAARLTIVEFDVGDSGISVLAQNSRTPAATTQLQAS